MNYLTSVRSNPAAVNVVSLLVRILVGVSMIILHGLPKLEKLMQGGDIKFFNFLGIGAEPSLIIALLLEIICSFLIILGLFTRLGAGMLILVMLVAAFGAHAGDGFKVQETSLIYLCLYLLIFVYGPGKYSVDAMISRRRESRW